VAAGPSRGRKKSELSQNRLGLCWIAAGLATDAWGGRSARPGDTYDPSIADNATQSIDNPADVDASVPAEVEIAVIETAFREKPPLVVVVDDQYTGRKILEQLIRRIDDSLEVVSFSGALEALQYIRVNTPDLILTDYKMPVMDGVTLIRHIRTIPDCSDVPTVVVTIVEDKMIRYQALDAGATDFLNRPIDEHECQARCRNLLTLRAQQKIIHHRARTLQDEVDQATYKILARERETLLRLAKAGEYRDEGTGNHVLRMARYCRLMAEALKLAPEKCRDIELAAPMHDIGKVGIPDRILLKPGPLSASEYAIMQRHARIGYEILKESPSHYLQLGATIALYHHEKFDGSGYPMGHSGQDIPLEARIVAVADVFDALTTTRPYKQPWSTAKAAEYLRSVSGSHVDPHCVEAFFASFDDIRSVHKHLNDEPVCDNCAVVDDAAPFENTKDSYVPD